jgi:hypothetical protein
MNKFVLLCDLYGLMKKLKCNIDELCEIIGVKEFEIIDESKFTKFMLQFPEHILKIGPTKQSVTLFTIKK